MPARAPKIGDRGGCPWAVKDRWPLTGWLSQQDAAYERRDVVEHVDSRKHHHVSTQGIESCAHQARDHAHGRVEEGVTCRSIDGGSEVLHEVVRDV